MKERVLNLVDKVQQHVWSNYLIALDEEDVKYIIKKLIDACVAVASIIVGLSKSIPEGDTCKIGIDIEKEDIWALYKNAKEQ